MIIKLEDRSDVKQKLIDCCLANKCVICGKDRETSWSVHKTRHKKIFSILKQLKFEGRIPVCNYCYVSANQSLENDWWEIDETLLKIENKL